MHWQTKVLIPLHTTTKGNIVVDFETIIADLQSEIVRLAAENADLKAMLLDKSTTIERIRDPLPIDRLMKLLPTIQLRGSDEQHTQVWLTRKDALKFGRDVEAAHGIGVLHDE